MSYGNYYPYIKVGLKVVDCITKSINNADEAKVELSFWDYLKIIGSCMVRYSGELPDASKSQEATKQGAFTI